MSVKRIVLVRDTHMFEKKIKTLDELGEISRKLKAEGKRIVHCHGVFDLMHPGHVKHFWSAREKGDVLIVTLTCDTHVRKGPGRPVFNERLRSETIASLAAVDYAGINYSAEAIPAIEAIQPHIYFKGGEYRGSAGDMSRGMGRETAAVRAHGGDVAFSDEETFSSSELLNQFFEPYSEKTSAFLKDFRQRYSYEDVEQLFKKVRGMKVLVIGEAIIDEYHYVTPMGKSAKEAILVTKYVSEESFAGGVLACANHLAGVCAEVDMVTVLGKENSGEELIRKSLKPNVNPKFFYNTKAPTIRKRRFIDPPFLTKMFEVYYFDDRSMPVELNEQISAYMAKNLAKYDLVIAVDYGHGLINAGLRDMLARDSKFLAVMTQANGANHGFHMVTKYPRADYVCIDHSEARLALGEKHIGEEISWEDAIGQLAARLGSKKFIITRGHEGSIGLEDGNMSYAPVFSRRIVDRVGAGDAFLAITSPLAAIGASNEMIGFIGNAVGAIAVTIVGNRKAVEPNDLMRSVRAMLK